MTPAIATARLDLRRREPGDAAALFATMSDPHAMRWWSRAPFASEEELAMHFDESSRAEDWRAWAIERREHSGAIGFVAAGEKRQGRVVEIGYLLAREHGGYGYAREAVAGVIDHLFGVEGHRRVFADTDPDNARSIRLLEALGFRREGLLRAEWETHIGVRDSVILGLLAEEWKLSDR